MIIVILAVAFMVVFLICEHYFNGGIDFSSIFLSLLIAVDGAFIGFLTCLFAMGIFINMPKDAKIVEYGPKTELVA